MNKDNKKKKKKKRGYCTCSFTQYNVFMKIMPNNVFVTPDETLSSYLTFVSAHAKQAK